MSVSPTPPQGQAQRQERADRLLGLLLRGPQTWSALFAAGFAPDEAAVAARDIAMRGQYRVRLGCLVIELEPLDAEGCV